ncbi:MAG: hypothetical protein ACI308_07940 [Muribaculaceae bacterium]
MNVIKKHLMKVVALMAIAVMATSCLDSDDEERTNYMQEFVIICAENEGNVWFQGENGLYVPTTLPTSFDLSQYANSRALLYYTELDKVMPGFDKVIDIAAINIASTKYVVNLANTQEEVDAYGQEGVSIELQNTRLGGGWLDMIVSYYGDDSTVNDFTLVAPDRSLIPGDVSVPSDYIYLELHRNVSESYSKLNMSQQLISFHLDVDHNPAVQGAEGIYLKFDNLGGGESFLTIDCLDN